MASMLTSESSRDGPCGLRVLSRLDRRRTLPLAIFPSPAGMTHTNSPWTGIVCTKLALDGNNLIIPARESLVRGIPTGDGKMAKLFFTVPHAPL